MCYVYMYVNKYSKRLSCIYVIACVCIWYGMYVFHSIESVFAHYYLYISIVLCIVFFFFLKQQQQRSADDWIARIANLNLATAQNYNATECE